MTKLDEMKKCIVDQIMGMNAKKFLQFQDTLMDFKIELKPTIDLTPLFTCSKCIKLYGKCTEDSKDTDRKECEKRFVRYGEQASDLH